MPDLRIHLAACDVDTQQQIKRRFERDGVVIDVTDDLAEIPAAFSGRVPDVLLFDADHDSDAVVSRLNEAKREYPEMPVILFARDADMPLVVDAMRAGAFDFVAKPLDLTRLDIVIKNASQLHRLMQRVNQLQEKYQRSGSFQNLVGQSPRMRQIYDMIEHVSRADVTCFVTGESGTGKELIAHAIHELSVRRAHRFVALSCTSVPRDMLESELFGYEHGHNGSAARYEGACEQAHGGTLFLDEICEMDPSLQAKVLRFLQSPSFHRMGGSELVSVDVRILASTSRDPMEEIRNGRLREDLYYRLNVVPIEAPPLRERRGDVPLLAAHFLERFTSKYGKYFYDFSAEALDAMNRYGWPGNVRELENTVERAMVLSETAQLEADSLPDRVRFGRRASAAPAPEEGDDLSIKRASRRTEESLIRRALAKTGGNRTRAAELLEISHRALLYKIKEYGVASPRGEENTPPPEILPKRPT